ncbi:MAG TPA: class I SAM-dependent methyltransferase [Thermoanaerobaculia bacterium]|nr:class I SAM-dependent methyltransferase [Thermoanaerobaculia bacterium]
MVKDPANSSDSDAPTRAKGRADGKSGGKRKKDVKEPDVDLQTLYEASVQNVDADVDFIERIWRKEHGEMPHWLREDFCGSASLAAHFVTRHPDNRALGVDLDGVTLAWGRRHRVERLGDAASRITLLERDVLHSAEDDLEVVTAFNFSYWIFRTREELRAYFASVHDSLRVGGVFFLDVFGGTAAMDTVEEETRHPRQEDPYGVRIPAFSYLWDQASFNPIDHEFVCHIHFEVGRGRRRKTLRKAFTYEWRFWTLPELRELLAEAGFSRSDVYVEGWDEEADEPDGIFRLRKRFDNEGSWIAYLVAVR